jgi:hypothetical membrane protein
MSIDEIIQTDIKSSLTKSGTLLFLAGFLIFMGIITCEILYRAPYNTHDSYISELATKSTVDHSAQQISAKIFNSTMITTGTMVIIAAFFVQKVFRKYIATIPLAFLGAGLSGAGIFPGNVVPWHLVFALIIFIFGGVAAIISYKIVKAPLRYLFVLFGIISLTFLFFNKFFTKELGAGGAERWLFYPIVFWLTGMGTYLLGIKDGYKKIL